MTRAFLATLLAAWVCAAQPPKPQEPPEEDESLIPKEYSFNPLQAAREIQVGNFYFKKGSFRAAAQRFEEATRWNPQAAEAFLRLAEARERLGVDLRGPAAPAGREKEMAAARMAYEKFLEAAPEDKRAASVRKKLAAWKP